MNVSIYQSIYDIIVNNVFGGSLPNELSYIAVELISLLCCIFLVVLPFLIVYKIVKVLCGD